MSFKMICFETTAFDAELCGGCDEEGGDGGADDWFEVSFWCNNDVNDGDEDVDDDVVVVVLLFDDDDNWEVSV